jgi:hypothetical protein
MKVRITTTSEDVARRVKTITGQDAVYSAQAEIDVTW